MNFGNREENLFCSSSACPRELGLSMFAENVGGRSRATLLGMLFFLQSTRNGMAIILLTGAGFTRNWGGWLANEAFEYLLGRTEIGSELRNRLWANRVKALGFEHTLGELQRQAKIDGDRSAREMVQEFMAALAAMFEEMNLGLCRTKFEWQNEVSMMIRPFLAQSDYIFTLNQDLLLEYHYMKDKSGLGKFNGVQVPGLKPVNSTPANDPIRTVACPHVCRIAIIPVSAPRCLGSAAMSRMV
jgi:hypothetical protein